ncbi:osteopetrosis-associated transmembrane protein 1-like [Rhopalosiphum maidis]|uniref:osteopetrosis-associated transmembrane protein 1-like n=1 Tax=Rhopalosiphum maidis TaxID=43146 RepID=UPI000F00C3D4|nr:osteopetrosis-associated transmembrane protein 1-like [Rhopalosiphum maidis]
MVKIVHFFYTYLFYLNAKLSLASNVSISSTIDVLPDGCQSLLQSFANETARFTLCVVTNARPITVCEKCVNEFNQVFKRYEEIQKLHNNDSEVDCRAVLTNIDRLQVVYASYNYVLDMWEKASCKLCLNGTVFNDKTKGVMIRGDNLDECISKHINDTQLSNSSLCADCKQYYINLTNYYNKHKNDNTFCMDVVDLINTTQSDWSLKFKCHVSNYGSEWVLLVISSIILLIPILFYFINWLISQERSNVLLSQNRWHERFTNNAASTSGYVVIS